MEAPQRPLEFTLLGDQPEWGASDPLELERVAKHLAALVLGSRERTPFTIGIKGDWGSGKSSLMRRLESRLREEQDEDEKHKVVSVWFNAWTAERGNTLEGLIKSVLEELDTNVLRRAARSKGLITGFRVFTTLLAGPLRLGGVVDAIWERASIDAQARNELREVLVAAMNDWRAKTTDPEGRLLVVFVDDLDRCSPDTVFQVFEAIKLYLDVRGFVFVIGFDETIVSEAILEQKKYSKAITSQAYTDKIVQIEYALTAPTDEQVRGLLECLVGDSRTHDVLNQSLRALVVQGSDRNPRRLKRFINAFVLEHTLEPDRDALEPETLIRTLIVQTFFRDFAQLYRDGGDPGAEFLTYLSVRELLRSGAGDDEAVAAFFAEQGAAVGDGLDGLERKLPEPFPKLARNENFVELVKHLHGDRRDDVRSRLEKAQQESAFVLDDTAAAPGSLAGLRIVWVDDTPSGIESIAKTLMAQGADVAVFGTVADAELVLRAGAVDLLISDVGRDADAEDGITVLARWREEGVYAGPTIFYVGRVTPERRERAAQLQAQITSTPGDLLRMVRLVEPRATSKIMA